MIGSIIGAIVIGAIIGALGRLFAPGRQNISILVTIIVGIIAAFIGSAIWAALADPGNTDTNGIDWIEHIIQVVLAVIGVIIAARLLGNRSRTH
ncbi:GlsB/YeaQ/YmgE family stress response membrane protein [uncultured Cellulomonas sp.]|uniref:GlsB/YeaQ/YmgE family stress response membrane protein n=1 Tax=uncultured Cellulomonas sp. TaxID=189682 RepID=UPI0026308331|nr:GlsB/YeaQ/YmgE family stress response membrane protein [uncultured Cellulomonas sp.]